MPDSKESNKSEILTAINVKEGAPRNPPPQAIDLSKQARHSICAVKLGRQTILRIGPERISQLLKKIHGHGFTTIIDDKLNDIDETNAAITRAYLNLGFDAMTVNPFAGWKGGLETTFKLAHKHGMGLLALVYMSHPGASEGYGQKVLMRRSKKTRHQFEIFATKAVDGKPEGAVVGATRPNVVRKTK